MNWDKGFSARYRAFFVDPITWRDLNEIDIIDGSISRNEDGLRESANVSVLNYDMETENWIRIYLDARQSSASYYGPLFTGIISAPSTDVDGNLKKNSLSCYSVLKPANDILLPKGWYAPFGSNVEDILRSLLGVVAGIPIEIEQNMGSLTQTIIAEGGETNLSMAEKILYYVGWNMNISGNGTIMITPPSAISKIIIGASDDNLDMLETSLKIEDDWFSCPNVFRAVIGDFSAIARDDDPNSKLSTISRMREIWYEESDCQLINENLQQYAERRLAEEQQNHISVSYTRRYYPDINVSDVITINYPGQGINGDFYISSQTIDLGYGAAVSETGYKI